MQRVSVLPACLSECPFVQQDSLRKRFSRFLFLFVQRVGHSVGEKRLLEKRGTFYCSVLCPVEDKKGKKGDWSKGKRELKEVVEVDLVDEVQGVCGASSVPEE